MPLVKNGKIVGDDYLRIADDAALPGDMPAIVPATRLLADAPSLLAHKAPLGVLWPNNRDVAELKPFLGKLTLIALEFPTFRDGRAYSQARLLRERLNFKGELRATGQVLRDQFLFMVRAGFDTFEVLKLADAEAFLGTLQSYSAFYQPAGSNPSAKRGTLDLVGTPTRVRSTV